MTIKYLHKYKLTTNMKRITDCKIVKKITILIMGNK